eukprot:TRINITY_DN28196_c0_g1_i1.p1 TRINITY_DN28196_c0_g1~~TRINITY_DN28196_c0_g1_i1.p1  ORF type:complete len:192 (+),score=17.71 TRINITY_DN28196_c0_g1_i1:239-814(+)
MMQSLWVSLHLFSEIKKLTDSKAEDDNILEQFTELAREMALDSIRMQMNSLAWVTSERVEVCLGKQLPKAVVEKLKPMGVPEKLNLFTEKDWAKTRDEQKVAEELAHFAKTGRAEWPPKYKSYKSKGGKSKKRSFSSSAGRRNWHQSKNYDNGGGYHGPPSRQDDRRDDRRGGNRGGRGGGYASRGGGRHK